MPWYRKKPIIVKARQLKEVTLIDTLEGTMRGEVGDWLIIGVNGEMYPCKPDIFKKTYEPVGSEQGASITIELEHDGKLYKGVLYAVALGQGR